MKEKNKNQGKAQPFRTDQVDKLPGVVVCIRVLCLGQADGAHGVVELEALLEEDDGHVVVGLAGVVARVLDHLPVEDLEDLALVLVRVHETDPDTHSVEKMASRNAMEDK